MKIRKVFLAERLATQQAIQSIEARAQSGALTNGPNGTLSVSMPIAPGELKRLAQLRGKLAALDALLGTQKPRTGRMVASAATSPAQLRSHHVRNQLPDPIPTGPTLASF